MTLVSLFRKVRYCCQTIFEKSGNLAGLFLESWIILLNFFANPQIADRSFSGIVRSRPEVFREKCGWPYELPGFGNGSRGWGLSPPYPHKRGVPPPPTGRPRGGIREAKTALAQRGPDEAPERLRAKARRGRNHIFIVKMRDGTLINFNRFPFLNQQ